MVPLRPGAVLASVDRYLALGSLPDFERNSEPPLQTDSHLGGARAGACAGVDANDDDDHPGLHARARLRGVPPELGRQPTENHRHRGGHQLLPTGESSFCPDVVDKNSPGSSLFSFLLVFEIVVVFSCSNIKHFNLPRSWVPLLRGPVIRRSNAHLVAVPSFYGRSGGGGRLGRPFCRVTWPILASLSRVCHCCCRRLDTERGTHTHARIAELPRKQFFLLNRWTFRYVGN